MNFLRRIFPSSQPESLPFEPPESFWQGVPACSGCSFEVPLSSLADEPIRITLRGLEAGQSVVLRLLRANGPGQAYEAFAAFHADEHGCVDLTAATPVYGTYEGIDGMGLFWSMYEVQIPAPLPMSPLAHTFRLSAEIQHNVVAEVQIKRCFASESVKYSSLNEQGLRGTLFTPGDGVPHPTLVCFGGGEGGLYEDMAALFASHGYTALALAFFGIEPLPREWVEIPLEYFARAIDWVRARPEADGRRVGVIGGSAGGSLSLLLGATFTERVGAVAAIKPTHAVLCGIYANPMAYYWRGIKSTWKYQGKPLPFSPLIPGPELLNVITGGDLSYRKFWDRCLSRAPQAARVPVERIDAPVLLIAGEDDQSVPSADSCRVMMKRLQTHHHPFEDEMFLYPGAGHTIWLPYLPAGPKSGRWVNGGEYHANARASIDAWKHVLAFFDKVMNCEF